MSTTGPGVGSGGIVSPVERMRHPSRLSSVRPDFAAEGRLAAALLDAMMDGSRPGPSWPVRRTVAIAGVTRRESTATPGAGASLVARTMDWLRAHATAGVRVGDAARAANGARGARRTGNGYVIRVPQFSAQTVETKGVPGDGAAVEPRVQVIVQEDAEEAP